jgi:hypothetical protein
VFPDDLEVQVRDQRDDARLVPAVELVSPRNKDLPESRRAFAAKCAAYLQRGIGVMLDIVTVRQANLHNDLMALHNVGEEFQFSAAASVYGVSYGPTRRQNNNQIDVWPSTFTLDGALPSLPLVIRGYRAVPIDLEATYTEARQRSRL